MRDAKRPSDGGVTLGCVERVGCGAEAETWCHAREYASFVYFPRKSAYKLLSYPSSASMRKDLPARWSVT